MDELMHEWIKENELDSWWADRPEESNIEFELEFRGNVSIKRKRKSSQETVQEQHRDKTVNADVKHHPSEKLIIVKKY